MELKDKNIEGIYPLSTNQQGILFHHLTQKEDQGLLHVHCTLEGELNIENLKKAWNKVSLRHSVLRTSVHWEKIKTPVQLIRPKKEITWVEFDFSALTIEKQKIEIEKIKKEDKALGVDLTKNPSSKISIIKTSFNEHILLWKCHHLLLDGWSASIILKDVFQFYEAISNKITPDLENIPSYNSYLNWTHKQNKEEVFNYWKTTFKGFTSSNLFNTSLIKAETFNTLNHRYSDSEYQQLKDLARYYRVTLNTLFQGIWSLLLARHFNTTDVLFGTTVSGRSGNFEKIELMAGMFTNTLPVRTVLKSNLKISDWLKQFQLQQQKSRNYENTSLEEINKAIDSSYSGSLFDNLFVFENFPWEPIKSGEVIVKDFKSGITTGYPINFIVKVVDNLEVDILSNSQIVENNLAVWFLENLKKLTQTILKNRDTTIAIALDSLQNTIRKVDAKNNALSINYAAPTNTIELELVKIWETLFNSDKIGTQDNFFELGGKSLMAVKMFSKIEDKFNLKLSPVVLLENSNIQLLANIISGDNKVAQWDYLVPVKSNGNNKPLFCIHGGGGHVFFFNPLANALNPQIPVYALQPSGINGEEEMHNSIEEMAIAYAKEIRQVSPNGPYHILTYCFSTAVGIELVNYLEDLGEQVHLIISDSLPEHENFSDVSIIKLRVQGFIGRILNNPFSAIKMMIGNNSNRFLKPIWINLFGSPQEKDLQRIQNNLIHIYNKYPWDKKHNAKTSLLLTKRLPITNQKYIDSWESLSTKKINIYEVIGKHHELFTGASAIDMAKIIEKTIL